MHPDLLNETISHLRVLLNAGKIEEAMSVVMTLHSVDRAEVFSELDEEQRHELLEKFDLQTTADLFGELNEDEAAELAAELPPEDLAEVLDEMPAESAADILGDLTEEQAQSTLAQMEEAPEVSPLLKYRDDTAGGLMSPEFIAVAQDSTCDDLIALLRQKHPGSRTPYYIFVVGPHTELVGVLALRDLITAQPHSPVDSIMRRDVKSVRADTDQEELAMLMKRYRLLLLPVVDHNGRLLGVVRSANIVEVIEEEATEDIYRLAGVADGQLQVWSSLQKSVARRLPWLYVNLLTAFLAAYVVSAFQATIEAFAVLAVFQGIVAGQGGNAGTQTLTLIVRGLALGEIELRDTLKVLVRELLVGLLHGIAVGLAVAVGAFLWIGSPWLGVVVGIALCGNMIAAAIAGTLVPLGVKAVKLDPALASGVLVTTVTDCFGFGLFLYLATIALPVLK